MTEMLQPAVSSHGAHVDYQALARSLAMKQAEHFFDAVLDGRNADEVMSENAAELDSFVLTLPPGDTDLFKASFEDEYQSLQQAVANNAELQAIIASGIAHNSRKRRRKWIARVSLAVGLVAFCAVWRLAGAGYFPA